MMSLFIYTKAFINNSAGNFFMADREIQSRFFKLGFENSMK